MQGRPSDYPDFIGIIVLLVINSTISFVEENNAGNAAAALMARLAPKAKVWLSISLIYDLVYPYLKCMILSLGSKRREVERRGSCNSCSW